jgi:hypothetical protein
MTRTARIGLKLILAGALILCLLLFWQGHVDFVYTGF